jgi:hypothetical protein
MTEAMKSKKQHMGENKEACLSAIRH